MGGCQRFSALLLVLPRQLYLQQPFPQPLSVLPPITTRFWEAAFFSAAHFGELGFAQRVKIIQIRS